MARPNNQAAIAGHVQGLRELKAAFQALPEIARDHLNDATELTLREAVRDAKGRLQASPSIRTRSLYNAVNWTLNRKSGRGKFGVARVTTTMSNSVMGGVGKSTVKVRGIVVPGKGGSALTSQGARLINPVRYAHLIEFGTKRFPAEPFIEPAGKAQRGPYEQRARGAGKLTERDVAKIGMQGGGLL